MNLDLNDWSVAYQGDSRIVLTRENDVIHVVRAGDGFAGEQWYFDFEPVDGPPVSEQIRAEDKTALREIIEMLVERHG